MIDMYREWLYVIYDTRFDVHSMVAKKCRGAESQQLVGIYSDSHQEVSKIFEHTKSLVGEGTS